MWTGAACQGRPSAACRSLALVLWFVAMLCGNAQARTDPAHANLVPVGNLHERVLYLPGNLAHPVKLQVTLYEPTGHGPFPLAVMNHGADEVSFTNRNKRYRFTLSAYYFLSRGYAVALPMMRGFAGSGGELAHDGCDVAQVGIDNAKDIRAVILDLAERPDIDRSRIVVAGQSFGGWNTLALGTLNVPGVRGLVNFVGAIRTSDCKSQDTAMIGGAAYFGHVIRLPSIWFYGDNDTVVPVATWRGMYRSYTSAGGHAELVAFGRFMNDSHQLLSYPESLPIWAPKLDAFLRRIGLPGKLVAPDYLPVPVPPASRYAAIGNVAAVPVNRRGRALYRLFLAKPIPRAFFVTPTGGSAAFIGGLDPFGRGLRLCQARYHCQPYAVDNTVVWTGHAPPTPAAARTMVREVSRRVPAGRTTLIDFAYDLGPDCALEHMPELRDYPGAGAWHGTHCANAGLSALSTL